MEQIIIESISSILIMIITMIFERYRYLNWVMHLHGEEFSKNITNNIIKDKKLPVNHINSRLYLFWWSIITFYV